GQTSFVGKEWQFGGHFHAAASFSEYPTGLCPDRDAPGCTASPAALVDGSGGLSIIRAVTGGGFSVLKASGTFRYSIGRDIGTEPDMSYGLEVSLEVPLGNGIALLGTYGVRWFKGRDDAVSTSSFTISQAFGSVTPQPGK